MIREQQARTSTERVSSSPRTEDQRGVELLTEIATRFYLHGQTQIRIAGNMGLDPSTVSRHLKRARDEGIVRVEIRPPRRQNADQGRAIAERYGLSRVVVASMGSGSTRSTRSTLPAVAADYIGGLLQGGMRVGVGWGETLSSVVQVMEPGAVTALTICQLAGGLSESVPGIQGHELVRQLATLYPDSRVQYLHAPSIVDSSTIRAAIMSDSSVEAALAMSAGSDLALVGIGPMDENATLIRAGDLSPADVQRLQSLGAIGSMNSRFYDAAGTPVTWLDDRTVGISWDELRAIPLVVAVAGGAHKAEAIRAALETGCVTVLVTDEEAGTLLLS
jgi:DNA-binding transcriptional regulator LsrR (DeoR family)